MSVSKKYGRPKPVVLITIEGLGIAPIESGTIIAEAKLRYLPDIINHYPAFPLIACDPVIGALKGQAASGEFGHRVIGLGRPVEQFANLIDQAISEKKINISLDVIKTSIRSGRLHLISLVSHAKKEASLDHLQALIAWAHSSLPSTNVYLHIILDGRDSGTKAGKQIVSEINRQITNQTKIASISGRMYALDMYNQKNRLHKALEAIINGVGNQGLSIEAAFDENYGKKIYDEEFVPTAIIDEKGESIGIILPSDSVVFCNIDPVAIRSLAQGIITAMPSAQFFSLSDYQLESIVPLYKLSSIHNSLGEVISQAGYRQLRIADSEGYGFVTAALNGGHESVFPLEDRRLVSGGEKDDYVAMTLATNQAITKEVMAAITQQRYDFIAVTFSCLDRIAHSGEAKEVITVLKSLDVALDKIITAVVEQKGVAVIVGSQGLIEHLHIDSTSRYHEHTNNPVPCILIGKQFAGYSLGLPEAVGGDLSTMPIAGSLIDIAPTILDLMGIPIPLEMTGKSFIKKELLP